MVAADPIIECQQNTGILQHLLSEGSVSHQHGSVLGDSSLGHLPELRQTELLSNDQNIHGILKVDLITEEFVASFQQCRQLHLDCSLHNVHQAVLVDVQLAGVNEGDDLLHHTGVDLRNLDHVGFAGTLQDPVEHGGPGLEEDGVAVELKSPALDADIGVLSGTEAAQGTQQPLGFLTAKKLITGGG